MNTWFWMRIAILVALVVAILVTPSDARAQAPIVANVVGEVSDPHIAAALAVADSQWRDFGREPDCVVGTLRLIDNPGVAAGANDEFCLLSYQVAWLAENLALRLSPDVYFRRMGFDDLCHLTVHEKGHLLGYADMDPVPGAGVMHYDTSYTAPLSRCAAWVDLMAPLPPSVAAIQPSEARKGLPRQRGEASVDQFCGRACRVRARAFARRLHESRCQKAYLGLTAGKRVPKVCLDSSRKR